MTLTVAPATEACLALVSRIDSGTAYSLDRALKYSRVEISPLDGVDALQVDVVAVEETQLNETFAVEDRTSHKIAIWYRAKLADLEADTIDAHCLTVRQIYQRVNNWDSADGRVRVWETDEETRLNPDKEILNQHRMFVAVIVLRVEVEAS